MKNFYCLLIISMLSFTCWSQSSLEVTLTSAGTLSGNVTVAQRSTITSLKINGPINAKDFRIMRDYIPLLETVDISNATIEAYTGTWGTYDPETTSYPYAANAIPYNAFKSKSTLKNIYLPSSCLYIGRAAFYRCSLTSIDLTYIKSYTDWCFAECTSLTSVVFGSSATYISANSFKDCTALESITFNYTTAMGVSSFDNCTALKSITFNTDTPPSSASPNFQTVDKTICKLNTRLGTEDLYKTVQIWMDFYSTPTGIDSHTIDIVGIDIYTINGILLKEIRENFSGYINSLDPGVYIVIKKTNSSVIKEKILIK